MRQSQEFPEFPFMSVPPGFSGLREEEEDKPQDSPMCVKSVPHKKLRSERLLDWPQRARINPVGSFVKGCCADGIMTLYATNVTLST